MEGSDPRLPASAGCPSCRTCLVPSGGADPDRLGRGPWASAVRGRSGAGPLRPVQWAERVPWRWQTALEGAGEVGSRWGCGAGAAVFPSNGEPGVGVLRLCRLLTRGRRDRSQRRALTAAPCSWSGRAHTQLARRATCL